MKTECTRKYYSFQALGRREIVAGLNGGTITSDGGSLLLWEVEQRTAIFNRFVDSFTDYRDENRIEHSVLSLVSQREFGNQPSNDACQELLMFWRSGLAIG